MGSWYKLVNIVDPVGAGGSSELVQPLAAALRFGPGARTGRTDHRNAPRPRGTLDVGHQRRLPAPRQNLPGQHRFTFPARPGGLGQLMLGCISKDTIS